MRAPAPDVDAYFGEVPEPARTALTDLRDLIAAAAPDAEQVISYGVPTFKLNGPLVGLAAFKSHCSLFVMSRDLMERMAAELEPYQKAVATLHFTAARPLPEDLVRAVVAARINENAERAARRRRR